MSFAQRIITVAMVVLGTVITRFLPFLIFSPDRETPGYIRYLGKVLPAAVFGMLVIFCLKNVSVLEGSRAVPEMLAIALTAMLHIWKRQMLVSIAGGTLFYMLLVQAVF